MIEQARGLGLPTQFLREMPSTFVLFEFEDLRQFAAEYHPEGHRMVLNRALSLNAAGGALKPLARMTSLELGTLYHELFHAYMDYLETRKTVGGVDQTAARFLEAARRIQQCRYVQVEVTPVVQKKSSTESRFLDDQESWEALNETWGVFVGWATWWSVELKKQDRKERKDSSHHAWLSELKRADREGMLVGYYEPRDHAERAKAPKHYLAPSYRITPEEVAILLERIFRQPAQEVQSVFQAMQGREKASVRAAGCED